MDGKQQKTNNSEYEIKNLFQQKSGRHALDENERKRRSNK